MRFLWHPYLIYGLNVLFGEEYIGKSALECWIAAQITRGKLPGELYGKPSKVLFVGSDEDDFKTVVGPRLYALNANLSLVREFVPLDNDVIFNVGKYCGELDRVLGEEEFALVIFEQLLDVLPPMRNSTDPLEVRHVTRPLRHVLKRRETTGLCTLHANKARSGELRQRQQGSIQFGALARSTIYLDRLPDDPERRVAVLGDANYVAERPALSFRIESCEFDLNGFKFNVPKVADVQQEDVALADVLAGPQRERAPVRSAVSDEIAAYLRGRCQVSFPKQVTPDTPIPERFSTADLARAVKRDTRDQSVRRALDELAEQDFLQRDDDKLWSPMAALFAHEDDDEPEQLGLEEQ